MRVRISLSSLIKTWKAIGAILKGVNKVLPVLKGLGLNLQCHTFQNLQQQDRVEIVDLAVKPQTC
jgi:hypothetical protein